MTVTDETIHPIDRKLLKGTEMELQKPEEHFLREFKVGSEKHWQIWVIAGGLLSGFKRKLEMGEIDLLEPFGSMVMQGMGDTPVLLSNAVREQSNQR